MSIRGFHGATVSARAVAGLRDVDGCIWGLEKAVGIDSVNLNGGAAVDAHCPVVDNSDLSGGGGGGGGNAQLNADSIAVTGNKSGCCFSPTPTTGVPPEADPLAGRAVPSFPSTCSYTR